MTSIGVVATQFDGASPVFRTRLDQLVSRFSRQRKDVLDQQSNGVEFVVHFPKSGGSKVREGIQNCHESNAFIIPELQIGPSCGFAALITALNYSGLPPTQWAGSLKGPSLDELIRIGRDVLKITNQGELFSVHWMAQLANHVITNTVHFSPTPSGSPTQPTEKMGSESSQMPAAEITATVCSFPSTTYQLIEMLCPPSSRDCEVSVRRHRNDGGCYYAPGEEEREQAQRANKVSKSNPVRNACPVCSRCPTILVPYDCDKNFEPCIRDGLFAHWACLVGFVHQSVLFPQSTTASSRLQHDNEGYFTLCAPTSSSVPPTPSNSSLTSVSPLHVIAYQGKSKHAALWPFEQLRESNAQLAKAKEPTAPAIGPNSIGSNAEGKRFSLYPRFDFIPFEMSGFRLPAEGVRAAMSGLCVYVRAVAPAKIEIPSTVP